MHHAVASFEKLIKEYLALYMPMRVSAGVSGNKSLPDPIPYLPFVSGNS